MKKTKYSSDIDICVNNNPKIHNRIISLLFCGICILNIHVKFDIFGKAIDKMNWYRYMDITNKQRRDTL